VSIYRPEGLMAPARGFVDPGSILLTKAFHEQVHCLLVLLVINCTSEFFKKFALVGIF